MPKYGSKNPGNAKQKDITRRSRLERKESKGASPRNQANMIVSPKGQNIKTSNPNRLAPQWSIHDVEDSEEENKANIPRTVKKIEVEQDLEEPYEESKQM